VQRYWPRINYADGVVGCCARCCRRCCRPLPTSGYPPAVRCCGQQCGAIMMDASTAGMVQN
jgi:hypothetical protein